MILSSQKFIMLLPLVWLLILKNIHAAPSCDVINITSVVKNTALQVQFPTNDLIKLNRRIRCPPNATWVTIIGCDHFCRNLEYGRDYGAALELQDAANLTIDCTLQFRTELQPPTLGQLNVTGDRVRLTILPPLGSFDSFVVRCPNNETFTSNISVILNIECSFVNDTPLMSFVLETVKVDFEPAVTHVTQEIPLPVPFTYTFDVHLLTVNAQPPPTINLDSTCEFSLIFYPNSSANVSYQREKLTGLKADASFIALYGLVPNLLHTIIFRHVVKSIGYAESSRTFNAVSDKLYPFQVVNVRIREEFNSVSITWIDPHTPFDPVEFTVVCNSKMNATQRVARNTSYTCQQMGFNQTDAIAIQTEVALPGYKHDSMAVAYFNVSTVPEIPFFEVINQTKSSLTIKWDYARIPTLSDFYEYDIECGVDGLLTSINIQSNEHQCQSLESGTLHVITMIVKHTNSEINIARVKSINGNTLLQKSRYQNHFYSPDSNGTRAVLIEWIPPAGSLDAVHVSCPSSNTTFESRQLTPVMYVKCIVPNGKPYNVTFATTKNGYTPALYQFSDTAPTDPMTTTTTAATTITPSTPAATSIATSSSSIPVTIPANTTVTTIPTSTANTGTSSTTPAPTSASSTTSATTVSTSITSTTTLLPTTQTATLTPPTAPTATTASNVTTGLPPSSSSSSAQTSSGTSTLTPGTTGSNSARELLEKDRELTKWRIIAIVAWIIAGFLLLATLALALLAIHLWSKHS